MNFMLCLSLLAPLKTAIEIKEPFPSPEQIWAVGYVLLALWIFAIGASVGSFINVVVYRLPLGLSLSSPGSRCPRCLHPIRLRHNLPILGWLLLRGRCADCQLPISPRYPLVELLVGSAFLLVGGVEFLGNGFNLPRPSPELVRTVLSTFEPQALAAATTVHLVLVATLLCAAIIEHDLRRVPAKLFAPVVLLTILCSVIWPDIHPTIALNLLNRLTLKSHWLLHSPWPDLLFGGIAGGLAGLLCQLTRGRQAWFAERFSGPLAAAWLAVGLVFGWQMIPLLLLTFALSQLAEAWGLQSDVQPRPLRDLLWLVVLSILLWRGMAAYPRLIGVPVPNQLLILSATTFVAALILEIGTRLSPAELVLPQPVADEAFLPTPEPPPELTVQSDEETGDNSSLSSPESREHE